MVAGGTPGRLNWWEGLVEVLVYHDQDTTIGLENRFYPDGAKQVDDLQPSDEGGQGRIALLIFPKLLGKAVFEPCKHARSYQSVGW